MRLLSRVPAPWRIVLICSLALNLAVAGLAVGAAFGPHGPGRGDRMGGPAGPVLRALPEEDRRAVIAELRRDRPERRGARRERFHGLLEAIAADPFDPARVAAMLDEQRRRGAERLDRIEGAVIARLARMDAAERAAFARNLHKAIGDR